jgi:DNA-binding Lrp family transcriptional regulator
MPAIVIPDELTGAVEGMDHPIRWRIIERLLASEQLSYSEIQDIIGRSNPDLTYHLQKLLRGGLVQQFTIQGRLDRRNSFYAASPFCRSLIEGMVQSLIPKQYRANFVSVSVSLAPSSEVFQLRDSSAIEILAV